MTIPEPEQLFSGRYQRLYKLGQGGMGQVWKCHDKILDKVVALKVLIENASDTAKRRFQTEARALAKLKHKNIVGIIDFGATSSEDLYMVMDYVSGHDLKETINRKGTLSVDETLSVTSQICDGLRTAHKQSLIHRDIKPSNILLVNDEEDSMLVKIVDFGTVRSESVDQFRTPEGSVIGSPLYMSPESAKGLDVDARSDIYSLGCLIYECLTGDAPFRGDTAQLTLMKHINEPPPEITSVDDKFLKSVVSKCLEKDPDERYQSTDELLTELINYYDSLDSSDFEYVEENDSSIANKPIVFRLAVVSIFLSLGIGCFFLKHLFPEKTVKSEFSVSKPLPMEDDMKQIVDAKLNRKPTIKVLPNKTIKLGKLVDDTILKEYLSTHKEYGRWDFGHSKVTDDSINLIGIDKLITLDVGSTYITDKSIQRISQAKKLSYLDIRNCGSVTMSGFASLKGMKEITSLAVGSSSVDTKWIDVIITMPKLNSLTFYSELNSKDIKKLNNLKYLSRLAVLSPSIEVVGEILKLPHLNALVVRGKLDALSISTIAKSKLSAVDLGKVELGGINPELYMSKINGPRDIILPFGTTNYALESLQKSHPNVVFIRAEEDDLL